MRTGTRESLKKERRKKKKKIPGSKREKSGSASQNEGGERGLLEPSMNRRKKMDGGWGRPHGDLETTLTVWKENTG